MNPTPMADGQAAVPDATWTSTDYLNHAKSRYEGGLAFEKKAGVAYWDAGDALLKAQEKYVQEAGTNWKDTVTANFGPYPTCRQLQRIAQKLTRAECEGLGVTELKAKAGIINVKKVISVAHRTRRGGAVTAPAPATTAGPEQKEEEAQHEEVPAQAPPEEGRQVGPSPAAPSLPSGVSTLATTANIINNLADHLAGIALTDEMRQVVSGYVNRLDDALARLRALVATPPQEGVIKIGA